ncbi:MAG TPA: hypothetical protein VIU64_21270 [Polyangia bacterium]
MNASPRRHLLALAFVPSFAASALAGGVAHAEEATYEIRKAAAPAVVGKPATVSVTVVGKNGWHVNEEAPITATVKADPGVTLPKPKLVRADLAESKKESARFDIPFSATEAGAKTITAQTRFVMCQEQACKPASETVAFNVDVQTPEAAAAAADTKGGAKTGSAKASPKAAKAGSGKPSGKAAPGQAASAAP